MKQPPAGLTDRRFCYNSLYSSLNRSPHTGHESGRWRIFLRTKMLDVSGAQAMLELCEALKSQGKTVACCGMTEAVRSYFDRAGITELLGEESYFWSADQAILDLLDAEIVE